tara:strand:- start:313 stop:468 length:156 start_codon:yes stop_codon:yes gene_type:complete
VEVLLENAQQIAINAKWERSRWRALKFGSSVDDPVSKIKEPPAHFEASARD